MCPEPALLMAYRDGTLFSRDVRAIEDHASICPRCAEILGALQDELSARPARSSGAALASQAWKFGLVTAIVVVIGIGSIVVLMRSSEAPYADMAPALPSSPSRDASVAPATSLAAPPPREVATDRARSQTSAPLTPAPAPIAPKPHAAAPTPETVKAEAPLAPAVVPNPPEEAANGDLVLRGSKADRRTVWRAHDRIIEQSTDGGSTWITEHTADRSIRAGAFVSPKVAWVVGESGLVLRRTPQGWFEADAPAEGDLIAVRASSPSKATVTFADGRMFSTANGGVTWSAQ